MSLRQRDRAHRTPRWTLASAFGLLGLVLGACSSAHTPAAGNGETHFLLRCNADDDCGADLACLCGVCTRTCTRDASCSALSENASCARPSASDSSCEDTDKKICMLECKHDDDCEDLGANDCREGQCRAPQSESPNEKDAGSHSTAGSGSPARDDGGAVRDANVPTVDSGTTPEPDDAGSALPECSLPAEVGPCDAVIPRFYHDPVTHSCELFSYGGCEGNANNFETIDQCEQACDVVTTPLGTCELPPESGPCDAAISRYYHDPVTHSCALFTYGGCDPNANNFATLKACEQACDVPASEPCMTGAQDGAFPGASISISSESCRVRSGMHHLFSYQVQLTDPLTFTAPDSGGSCGRCGGYSSDPLSLAHIQIGDTGAHYCECDVGCCAPTTSSSVTLSAGLYSGTLDWPGVQWDGPSDTQNPYGAPFPAGSYDVIVHFAVPGVGELDARLPIEVIAP